MERIVTRKRSIILMAMLMVCFTVRLYCGKNSGPVPENKAAILRVEKILNNGYKAVAPISLSNESNITIRGDSINGGSNYCIQLYNCKNIYIINCKLQNSKLCGVYANGCTGITFDSCYMSNAGLGFTAVKSSGIGVYNSQFLNMTGGQYSGDYVQFNNVTGANNAIENNKCQNNLGESNPEDGVSLYQSNGTAPSPIIISNNWIKGYGTSTSGSGIMTGDGGGSYQKVTGNILVNTGNVGIGCAGGSNITVSNNEVYSASNPVSNVGIYVNNYSGAACSLITVNGNKVTWINKSGQNNPAWNSNTCGTVNGWGTNNWNAGLTAGILPGNIVTAP